MPTPMPRTESGIKHYCVRLNRNPLSGSPYNYELWAGDESNVADRRHARGRSRVGRQQADIGFACRSRPCGPNIEAPDVAPENRCDGFARSKGLDCSFAQRLTSITSMRNSRSFPGSVQVFFCFFLGLFLPAALEPITANDVGDPAYANAVRRLPEPPVPVAAAWAGFTFTHR